VLIHELRPAWSQEVRLDLALSEYARDWAELNGCALEFSVVGDRWLPADVQEALFRITQEALSNVARHSCATRIVVALRLDQGDVRLKIQDDGCGFDVGQANHGFGLNSMRERAALIGACLSVFSTSEAGTTVEVIVPA
jgi:signal transduction histidine kinase